MSNHQTLVQRKNQDVISQGSKSRNSSQSPANMKQPIHIDRFIRLARANAFFDLHCASASIKLDIRDLVVLDYIFTNLQTKYSSTSTTNDPIEFIMTEFDEMNWKQCNKNIRTWVKSFVNELNSLKKEHSLTTIDNYIEWEQLSNIGIKNSNLHLLPLTVSALIKSLKREDWRNLLKLEEIDFTRNFSHTMVLLALINDKEYLPDFGYIAADDTNFTKEQERLYYSSKIHTLFKHPSTRGLIETVFHGSQANILMKEVATKKFKLELNYYLEPSVISKPTLVLDLDETLIHANMERNPAVRSDFQFTMTDQTSVLPRDLHVNVYIRPYVKEFLQFCGEHFEVILFTAALQTYADTIVDHIDPKRIISRRFYRRHCTTETDLNIPVDQHGNFYVKDLRKLNRDMTRIAILDNAAYAYAFQFDNGIPIRDFRENMKVCKTTDVELLELIPFLDKLKEQNDFPAFLRSTFQIDRFQKVAQENFTQNPQN